ncbi:TonB-dependent receptor [Nafulsella turpanensis]|uniref:TonB-dependent receptor n=1 Tax=Nafulsella turpanensis TaxID=1265690 RepID=UPI0003726D8E|nr:carboxypeptidase-like regulatory domain-containing protein [Nafulsella turpanensis]
MRKKSIFLLFLTLFYCGLAKAQEGVVQGKVSGEGQQVLEGASVTIPSLQKSTTTNKEGFFSLTVPATDSFLLKISFVGYRTFEKKIALKPGQSLFLAVPLEPQTQYLDEVAVNENRAEVLRDQSSISRIEPKQITHLTSPFGDISATLATLPGVRQNNELSSAYSVRGGNFDENLVYVNEIPIYRPFLVRAGQQEGLSFVNPALVEQLHFSSGGWQAKWGDKLSSVLSIRYKEPDSVAATVTAGLLGGAAHIEGASEDGRFTYLAGVRHKSAQYLLNTLDTEGEYLPRFTDLQSFLTYRISENTSLDLLLSYARNRYLVEPQSRQTSFGTLQQAFQLNVGFEGRELLNYDMWQNAVKLSTRWNRHLKTSWIASYLYTTEREYVEVEGGYYLCNIDKNPSSDTYNECLRVLGVGTDYLNIRNSFKARILNLQSRNEWRFAPGQLLEFGLQYSLENIDDRLREWEFADSADFVKIKTDRLISNDITLQNQRLEAYVQNTSSFGLGNHTLHYGLRLHYFDLNQQWLLSPRAQYSYRPDWLMDIVFTAAAGLYHQPPLYREYRDRKGGIVAGVLAQQSMHLIAGSDLNFRMWDRVFNFVSEVYYKKLWDVNAYSVENVRIRYFANNESEAYATGADLRLSGEFVRGAESWFSLGLLKTEEDIPGATKGYIARPSDQLVNLGIFFQDHIPNDPSLRVYLKLLYGTGLPFGPPQNIEYRNLLRSRSYRRVDIGFSKIANISTLGLDNLWLGLEILNLLGNNNIISYTWISDFNNNQYAVPNTLSSRFFNLKVVGNW